MNILCAYHAQNVETCKWVLENTESDTNNITVQLWREACEEFLANHTVDNNPQ